MTEITRKSLLFMAENAIEMKRTRRGVEAPAGPNANQFVKGTGMADNALIPSTNMESIPRGAYS